VAEEASEESRLSHLAVSAAKYTPLVKPVNSWVVRVAKPLVEQRVQEAALRVAP